MSGIRQRALLFVKAATLAAAMTIARSAAAGQSEVDYVAGLEAESRKDAATAAELFEQACMGSPGSALACLRWADYAAQKGDESGVRRALASAVLFDPQNVEARVRLGVLFLKNEDFSFAREHLRAAADLTVRRENRAIIYYYLGYIALKTERNEEAARYFESAQRYGTPDLQVRAAYFLGRIAAEENHPDVALRRMRTAAAAGDPEWSAAARDAVERLSVFPLRTGISGRLSASLAFNSHPSAAFLDETRQDSPWVMQSVFRGDFSARQSLRDGAFTESLTLYREQNWLTLNPESDATDTPPGTEASAVTAKDLNLTLPALQLSYEHRAVGRRLEHTLRIGADAEAQLLDSVPKKSSGTYIPSGFGVHTWAIAGKLWWSFARKKTAVHSLRLKAEFRPNYVDKDRSSIRLRLRAAGRYEFAGRSLRLDTLLGLRFDRTYEDPAVIRYDRLLPEARLALIWRDGIPRTTVTAGITGALNWYLNSKHDRANSFRTPWQDDPFASPTENAQAETAYYNEFSRLDPELNTDLEVSVALWPKAEAAARFEYTLRDSNIDDAPVPDHFVYLGERPHYGYTRYLVSLEIRQRF